MSSAKIGNTILVSPNYGSSEKLSKFFKPGDELITLKGAGHTFMDRNPVYLDSLKSILR